MTRHLARLITAVLLLALPALAWAGPLAPLTPSGPIPTTTSVTLTWQAVSGAQSYAVRVQDPADPALRDPRNSCSSSYVCQDGVIGTSYTVPVTPGRQYSWWVHSTVGGINSPAEWASFKVVSTPTPPPGPTAKLTLTWQDNSTTEDGFAVEWHSMAVEGTGVFAELARTPANTTAFVHTPVVLGAEYCYRVLAFNAAGKSVPSNTACATVQPPATIPAAPGLLRIDVSVTINP